MGRGSWRRLQSVLAWRSGPRNVPCADGSSTRTTPLHGAHEGPLQHELVKARTESQQADDLEIDVQSAKRQHRLAITVGKRQVGDIERERVWVEADLTQRKLALVMGADEIGQTRA